MKKHAFLLLAIAGLLSGHSLAALTLFTDPASFNAALTSSSTLSFSVPAGTDFVDQGTTPSFTLSPTSSVKFSSSDPSFNGFLTVSNTYDGYTVYAAPVLVASGMDLGKPVTITLTSNIPLNALSFDAGSVNGSNFTFTTSNNDSYSKVLPSSLATTGPTVFSGFTSSDPFTSLTITTTAADAFILQDLKIGTTAPPVPEPTSLSLLGLGLAGLVVFGLRNKRTLANAVRY